MSITIEGECFLDLSFSGNIFSRQPCKVYHYHFVISSALKIHNQVYSTERLLQIIIVTVIIFCGGEHYGLQ